MTPNDQSGPPVPRAATSAPVSSGSGRRRRRMDLLGGSSRDVGRPPGGRRVGHRPPSRRSAPSSSWRAAPGCSFRCGGTRQPARPVAAGPRPALDRRPGRRVLRSVGAVECGHATRSAVATADVQHALQSRLHRAPVPVDRRDAPRCGGSPGVARAVRVAGTGRERMARPAGGRTRFSGSRQFLASRFPDPSNRPYSATIRPQTRDRSRDTNWTRRREW